MNTESTSIKKGYYGWTGESIVTNVNGYDWCITTMKRSSGKIISSAQAGKKTPNGFNFAMFTDPRKELGFHVGNATEKSIKEAHYKALALFDQLKENNELVQESQKKEYEIKPGQIIFLNGYGQNENFHDRKVIYNIEKTQWGTSYHYLNIDKLETGIADNIRDIDNKFGIGTYYKKDDVFPLDDKFNNLLIETIEKEKKEEQRKQANAELIKAQREAKIEEGKKIITIPEKATSVIVAHFKKDDSDSMTDYFSHSTEKTIYLAFSTHNRDLFTEMRSAALNCNEVRLLADLPKDAENRHKYSMGSGYWLGEHLHHGWEIRKERLVESNIFIAASEGRVYFPEFGLNDKVSIDRFNLPEVGYRFMKDGWEHEIYNVRDKENNQKIYFKNLNTNDEYNLSAKDFHKQLRNGKITFSLTTNLRFSPGPGVELKQGDLIELSIKEGEKTSLIQGTFVALENFGQIIHLENVITDTLNTVDGKNEVSRLESLELNVHDAIPNTIIEPVKIVENKLSASLAKTITLNSTQMFNEGTTTKYWREVECKPQTVELKSWSMNNPVFYLKGVVINSHDNKEIGMEKKVCIQTYSFNLKTKIEEGIFSVNQPVLINKKHMNKENITMDDLYSIYLTMYSTEVQEKVKEDFNYNKSMFNDFLKHIGSGKLNAEELIEYSKENSINQNQLNNNKPLNNEVMKKDENVKEQTAQAEVKTENGLKFNEQGVKGNLVKAPEVKELEGGKKLVQFTVGVNETSKIGKVTTNFIDCSAFGKQAEKIEGFNLEKGAYLEVGGKANFYETSNDDKVKNYHNSITVNHIQVLGKEKGSNVGVETKFDKPNHIEIKGNLVKAPEYKNLPGGKLVAEVTLAHNYIVGDKPEDKRVMYINANVFGKAAEAMQSNNIEKGASIGLKGSIENQIYTDKDNNKRQAVKINSNFVELSKSKDKVEDKEVSVDVQAETKKAKSKAKNKGKEM